MEEGALNVPVPQTNDQKHLKEFILALEILPEVWDTSNEDILNKMKKANAYEKLLGIYKKIKPAATTKDVMAKVNSLKSNYRKEVKKIIASERSGAEAENIYSPKSWVFHMMHFLNKNEKPVNRIICSEPDKYENEEKSIESTFSCNIELESPPPPKKLKKGLVARQNEPEKASNYLSPLHHPVSTVSLSNIDPTALYWTHKLQKLNSTQRLLAEKAINDIIFEAELGTLKRDSVQINITSPALDRFDFPIVTSSPSIPIPHSVISMSTQSVKREAQDDDCVATSSQTINIDPDLKKCYEY